jgi:hypothetical protein
VKEKKKDMSEQEETQLPVKWQPMVVLTCGRIECGQCGALATFIVLADSEGPVDEGKRDFSYESFCQDCFTQLQNEIEQEEQEHE